ncbi:MAG: reductase [Frankiales bacterium]|nr:reductase [Frankiales bacterium]
MSTAVLVGNPKARSRTFEAAVNLAVRLTGHEPDLAVDLADFGSRLLERDDPEVADALKVVPSHDLVIVASPTYKATYTGLLKVFLDLLPSGGLSGVTVVPLMLGGHWGHGLAPELSLKPVLTELGATAPTRGLFLLDAEFLSGSVLEGWLTTARGQLAQTAPGAFGG